LGAFEMAAIQAAVLFQMSDHRLYRLPSFDPAPLPSCQRLGLAAMQDLHTLDSISKCNTLSAVRVCTCQKAT
ncbi:hypothetical protein IXO884_02635, partial [Xanthomonas oryzae pv. oryzae]